MDIFKLNFGYKQIKKQILSFPKLVNANIAAVRVALKFGRINHQESEELFQLINQKITEFNLKFKQSPSNKYGKIGILVIDIYDSMDDELREENLEYTHYESASRIVGMQRVAELLQVSKKLDFNIYATTSVSHETEDKKHIIPVSKLILKYVSQDQIVVKQVRGGHHIILNAFENTILDLKLKADGIKTLIVLGSRRNDCIIKSIEGAIKKGYRVITSEELMFDCKPGMFEVVKNRNNVLRFLRKNKKVEFYSSYKEIITLLNSNLESRFI